MVAYLAALLFVGFITTSAISYLISRHSIRNSILENELPLSSNSIYSEVQRDLFEPILISSLMANDTFVKDWILNGEKDQGEINRYLAHIEKKYGTTTAFLVSEKTHRYYNRSGVLKVVSESNPADDWYFRVSRMETAHEVNIDPDLSNHATMSIFVNFRIISAKGEYLGATGVGLEVSALKTLMQDYRARFNRDVYFYDREGQLVLHSRREEGDHAKHHHRCEPTMREIMRRVGEGEKDVMASSEGSGGALVNYRYLPELDWILVVEQVSDGTRGIFLKSVGFNLVICLLVGWVLGRAIQRRALRYQRSLEAQNRLLEAQQVELQEANAARERLFAIIGHDLRTPVGNLKSSLDLLSEGELDRELWGEIRDDLRLGVNHTLGTLENLMEWGSLQSGALQTQPVRLVLAEVAQGAVALLALAAKAKGVVVVNDIPPEAVVQADAQQVASILRNLLSNAIKFTPHGGRIEFSATPEGEGWRVSVSDTGIGIAEEQIARVLSDGQLSTKGTGNEPGLGLGLQLCRDFARANGGDLKIESIPGKGSTFSCRIGLRPSV